MGLVIEVSVGVGWDGQEKWDIRLPELGQGES